LRILFLGARWGFIRAATVTAGDAVAFRATGQVITQNPEESFRLHRHQPSPVLPAVRHDGQLAPGIAPGLVHGGLDAQPLDALDLEMESAQFLAHHVRRVRTAGKLLPPAGVEAFRSQHVAPLALASFSFFSGVHAVGVFGVS
jgi:hypothetical protein